MFHNFRPSVLPTGLLREYKRFAIYYQSRGPQVWNKGDKWRFFDCNEFCRSDDINLYPYHNESKNCDSAELINLITWRMIFYHWWSGMLPAILTIGMMVSTPLLPCPTSPRRDLRLDAIGEPQMHNILECCRIDWRVGGACVR